MLFINEIVSWDKENAVISFSGEAAIFGRPWNRGPVATVVFQKWREPVRNVALYYTYF
jgi:hypothetical protein